MAKKVLKKKVATRLEEKEGGEKIVDTRKESGEDYAKKILEFLEATREARQRKKKEGEEVIKHNVSPEVFQPTGEKGEAEKNRREEGVQQMKLYPPSGLMVMHNDKLNKKEPEKKVQGKEKTRQSEMQRTV